MTRHQGPTESGGQSGLGRSQQAPGDGKARGGAIVKFQEANQRGPHWCDPLEHWGEALAAEGNYRAAVEKYAEAAHYTPGWGVLELHWSQALDKLGEHSQALTHYQAAQEHGESLTAAEHATLAKLLAQSG